MSLLRLLIYSNLWISIGAFLLTFQTYIQFQITVNYWMCSFVFFSTLVTYNFQRLVKHGQFNNIDDEVSKRHKWIFIKRKGIAWLAFFGFFGMIISFLNVNFTLPQIFLILFVSIISIFYALKVFNVSSSKNALRDLPFIKIVLITISWVVVTALIPFIHSGFDLHNKQVILVLLSRGVFIFSITIPFDIRDLKHDKKNQKTIPQLFGKKRAKDISVFLMYLFLVLSIPFNSFIVVCAFLISMISTIILIQMTNQNRDDFFYAGLLDGMMVLQPVLIYFAISVG